MWFHSSPRYGDGRADKSVHHSAIGPVVSPAYADVKEFPPVLLICGSRDFFLSGTLNFHRQLLRSGASAELVVFDAMPHVHWENPDLPESKEALDIQARSLAAKVGGQPKIGGQQSPHKTFRKPRRLLNEKRPQPPKGGWGRSLSVGLGGLEPKAHT